MLMGGFSAFAVGFVSNMYGRFFDGNAFVVMVGSSRTKAKATSVRFFCYTDHWYPFPSALWTWKRGSPELRVRPDGGIVVLLPERVPDSPAADLCFNRTYGGTWDFSGCRTPHPESPARGWLVQLVM